MPPSKLLIGRASPRRLVCALGTMAQPFYHRPALHGYHDNFGCFPHAYDCRALFVNDPSHVWDGRQWIVTRNWATLILPFIEQANLDQQGYAAYQILEPASRRSELDLRRRLRSLLKLCQRRRDAGAGYAGRG
jgi:hypothetical protein